MDILIIGLGVIGSTYGYLFHNAGCNVEHYVRSNSSKFSLSKLNVEFLDGRTNASGIWKKDEYIVKHMGEKREFDFIFVSVPAGGIADVMKSLKEQNIRGTVILACGIWDDRSHIDRIMDGWNYILGYPVAGGNIDGTTLNCCVFDHFMLEGREKAGIKNYDLLIKLLSDCQIKQEIPYDMLEWIWIHMAINAGVITTAGKYGDINNTSASAEKLMDSAEILSKAVLAIRETTKIIAARNVNLKKYRNELLPYKVPSKLAGIIMKKMFAKNELSRKIMTLHNNQNDLLYVCKNVCEFGKANYVAAPVFYANCKAIGICN